ncbi:hypothetical protein [Streptomyces tauricus]|uniref:hypothetical protein n=1 Tax=Streptomyces tauricus TaxID=68274 RepID=UPI0034269312
MATSPVQPVWWAAPIPAPLAAGVFGLVAGEGPDAVGAEELLLGQEVREHPEQFLSSTTDSRREPPAVPACAEVSVTESDG